MLRALIQISTIGLIVSLSAGAQLKCYIDIVFLLDSSGSIGASDFQTQLNFVKGVANEFHIGRDDVQIGVVSFSGSVQPEFSLKDFNNDQTIIRAIGNIRYIGGGTATDIGLDYVYSHSFTSAAGARQDAASIVIVLTDGQSNNGAATIAAAARFKHKEFKVISVGVGAGVAIAELRQIASNYKWVYQSTSYNALHSITQELHTTACNTIKTVELQNTGSGGSPSPGSTTDGNGRETGGVPMVKQGGVWAEICGDGVDVKDATVICRTLGYGDYLHHNRSNHLAQYSSFVDAGSLNVITDVIECTGNEARIILCPLREHAGSQTCNKRVVINCVPTLSEAITSHCTTTHWNISIDMDVLNITNPGSVATSVYLGDGTCTGTLQDGYRLVFNQDLRTCRSHITYTDTNKVYTNQLVYAFHDPVNPNIIRYYNWTMGVTCLHQRDQSANTHVTYNETHSTNGTLSSSAKYQLFTQFYSDPHFGHSISGSPLHVPVGTDVYMKVLVANADLTVEMKLESCYMQSSQDLSSAKYYLIRNGCATDVNTHILSTAVHETKFVFKAITSATGNGDMHIHCDAIFCTTSSHACSKACN